MSQTADLSTCLNALAGARVVALGDVMLDRFVYGSVERISPEAPVPVLKIARETVMLGGAGNVLRNLAALGAGCRFLSVVGDDASGSQIRDLAGAEAGASCQVLTQAGRQTTIKERFIAGGQQLLRGDRETVQQVDAETAAALVAEATAAMAEVEAGTGVLVLSDYGKGVLTPATTRALIEAARAAGWPVVVDPKGRDYALYRGATLVTPNRRELAEASGLPTGDDAEVVAACRAVIETAGIGGILATRSEQGMTLVTASPDAVLHLPAEAREVFDVSGAGDTVVAMLGAALAAGADAAQAARLANVAAGIVVGKLGTAVARPAEILHALHAADFQRAELKVADREGMLEQAGRWRAAGLRIGFTNGCFDLLHPGHVSLLAQARRACDRLIVGLNSDASVRRLKGAGRPVQAESARATVLASLADVALVTIFDEDTPLALLAALRPEVLIKGADYALDQVVGADLVQGYGGRVVLAKLADGHSTSGTIKKLTGS